MLTIGPVMVSHVKFSKEENLNAETAEIAGAGLKKIAHEKRERREKRSFPFASIRVFRGQPFQFASAVSAISAFKCLFRREDTPAAFAKPDSPKAFAFAKAFHDHLVAVFEKAPLLAGR